MDVDATPGGLDTAPTVGATLLGVSDLTPGGNRKARVIQRPAVVPSTFLVEAGEVVPFDPWGDLIEEHDAVLAPKANTPLLRTDEQNEILGIFAQMLAGPLGDGGAKRARGEKPNWKVDPSHDAKARKHLDYVERYDHESGCHKYTHAACRLLMQAYQEMVADGLVPVSPT